MSKYSRFAISNKLHKSLGDMEDKLTAAQIHGSAKGVDRELGSKITGTDITVQLSFSSRKHSNEGIAYTWQHL